MGKTVSIKIGGSVFSIRSPAGDARIQQLEEFINRKFEEIKSRNPRLTYTELLALTLLHITDALIDSDERNIRMRTNVLGEIKSLKHAAAEISEFIDEKANVLEDEAG